MSYSPEKRRHNKRGATVASLNLNSLMDMFTIILIFLLVSFSTERENPSATTTFKLPSSTSEEAMRPRLTIQITQDVIIVEGKQVVNIKDIDPNETIISPLYAELQELAKTSIFIAEVNAELELDREVVFQGDRTIPFALLQRLMFTCGQVGYSNISLAVTRKALKAN
ncbi:MAG: biopolymer transporter ExbD [Deltaproteobacteria bacterium]|nr:biopolymer transporter ExbD [Deltaproteobacteria bacterium]